MKRIERSQVARMGSRVGGRGGTEVLLVMFYQLVAEGIEGISGRLAAMGGRVPSGRRCCWKVPRAVRHVLKSEDRAAGPSLVPCGVLSVGQGPQDVPGVVAALKPCHLHVSYHRSVRSPSNRIRTGLSCNHERPRHQDVDSQHARVRPHYRPVMVSFVRHSSIGV